MDKIKLLVVEDDPNLGTILTEYLNLKGFSASLFCDGVEGLKAYHADRYDLCVFDVMMPKKDGFSLAADIRKVDKQIPIIFLTAKSMKEDTLQGFKVGGDDYITKPFSMEELLMRINAILRRVKKDEEPEEEKELSIADTKLDLSEQKLWIKGVETKLTPKECGLLKVFIKNKNKTISRSYALKEVWGDDSYFNARSMDVYIAKLRKYLKQDEKLQIMTVHGEGFKLLVEE